MFPSNRAPRRKQGNDHRRGDRGRRLRVDPEDGLVGLVGLGVRLRRFIGVCLLLRALGSFTFLVAFRAFF